MRIAVLVGGTSAEREVSLATGRSVVGSLTSAGHDVVIIDTARGRRLEGDSAGAIAGDVGASPPDPGELGDRTSALQPALDSLPSVNDAEVVFIALHGGAGEDGHLQALLDLAGIAYTGSGHLGSALAMDKLASKELFVQAGVPTPPWLNWPVGSDEIESALGGYPIIVKPACEGSTVGVSLVREADGLAAAAERAAAFGGPVLLERFIPGRELAVGILGEEALPIVEIVPSHEIYDYECKYTKGRSEYRVPAPLPEDTTQEVQSVALAAHRALRLESYSRIDLRLDEEGRPWCLEANSLPGLTETSLLPKAAAAAGIPFGELCERIVELALGPMPRGTQAATRG